MKKRHGSIGRIHFGTRGWRFNRWYWGPRRWARNAFGISLGPLWIGYWGPKTPRRQRFVKIGSES